MTHLNEKILSGSKTYLVLALVIALFYGNTLANGFVYDDVTFIVKNESIRSIANIGKVLTGCFTDDSFGDCKTRGLYYRPFLSLHLLLTYQISQEPWFFHLVNIFLLFIGSILVFKLFESLGLKRILAFFGALIFLINPVNSEAGNFISTVNDHYLLIFFSLSLIFYIKFRKTGNLKYLVTASITYFLALSAKEAAAFLIVLIFAYEGIFNKLKNWPKKSRPWHPILAFLLPLVIYFLLRIVIFGRLVHQLVGYHDLNFVSQILTSFSIYPLYLIKLIYPLPLNAQHDPPIVNAIDWRFFVSAVFWIVNLSLVYLAFKKKMRFALFGLAIIFVSLLPILLFINKIGRFILAERYLYLATVGVSLILVEFVQTRYRIVSFRSGIGKVMLGAFLVYMGVSWWIVINRNRDWHDEFSFNRSIARLTKTNHGVWYNLGTNYSTINKYQEAIDAYLNSIAIDEQFWPAHHNLANAYLALGDDDKASTEYKIVLSLNPDNNSARVSLNNLSLLKSGTESAKLSLNRNLIRYRGKQGLSFDYPVYFRLRETNQKVIVSDSEGELTVEISVKSKPKNLSAQGFVKQQSALSGNLVNEGLAQIPNVDEAWVKVWNTPIKPINADLAESAKSVQNQRESAMGSETALQFFLFDDSKVAEVVVGPADSDQMKAFDGILGTIQLATSD